MSEFTLYPEEQRWWSNSDYRTVLRVTRHLEPKTVLEFGPGSSTLSLIEGGAKHIDTCEDDDIWAEVYQERLVDRFPSIVSLHRYIWSDPVTIAALDNKTFDLGLIDGPQLTPRRPPVIFYALQRCKAVLVPTEDDGRVRDSYLRPRLRELAGLGNFNLYIFETGPLSGGFALFTRKA